MNRFLLLFILFFVVKASAQTCPPNIGFERGDFTGWELLSGYVDTEGKYFLDSTGTSPVAGRQEMISKGDRRIDPYGRFPIVSPNGSNYSIKLGNTDVKPPLLHGSASRISYTFVVPTSPLDYSITYNYAIVLQDPAHGQTPHSTEEKPFFSAEIYDVESGQYITCASFSYNAGTSLPGFTASRYGDAKGIVYTKSWSQASINLRGFGGKKIRLEFTARDCTPGGHFGYAYLDVSEPCGFSITGNNYCINQKGTKLYAPQGYSAYTWYNADSTKVIGTGNPLTLNPVPADNTVVHVKLVPYADLGCPLSLTAVIHSVNASFNFTVLDSVGQCPDKPTYDLTAAAITKGSDSNLAYTYYTDPDGLNYVTDPSAVTSGTYYIKAVNPYGCSGILPVNVVINNPVVDVKYPNPVTYPAGIDITQTFTHDPKNTYSYYYDYLATKPIPNFVNIHYPGMYYIKATSIKYGCSTVTGVYITINPPPPPTITGSTLFTPNGDGINDTFNITIKGFGEYRGLKVYNRYGKEVFSTTDFETPWDGTYQGKPLPFGTYYWLFTGINTFDRSPVHESGAVTLVR